MVKRRGGGLGKVRGEMPPHAKESTLRFYKERLMRVLLHIQEHLDEPLPLEKLATLACLSRHHFHHVFTGMIGESLASHIRRLRLERAACRLKLSALPVIQIALEAGYETHEAFSRAFRSSFKASPTQFRRRHCEATGIPARSGVHYGSEANVKSFRTTPTGGKKMKVTIKRIEPMRVAFMRHIGPYNEVSKIWDKLMMFLGKEGLVGGDSQFIGICHDDPAVTPPEKVRYDACVTVGPSFNRRMTLACKSFPAAITRS